jgi:hypothetical protein
MVTAGVVFGLACLVSSTTVSCTVAPGPGLLAGISPDAPFRLDRVDGRAWFVFGDTFGRRSEGHTSGGGTDETGRAKELIPGKKVDNNEMTIIPTYGFAANSAMYLANMSVRRWGEPGEWETNYAGLAKPTDGGQNWTRLESPRWDGQSNFVQVSVVGLDGKLCFWGVTHGRFGCVALMRVAGAEVERQDAHEYFTGVRDGEPAWGRDPAAATPIVNRTVDELSVVWNTYLERWIMTATDGSGLGSTIRERILPWGPWDDPKPLVTQEDLLGVARRTWTPGTPRMPDGRPTSRSISGIPTACSGTAPTSSRRRDAATDTQHHPSQITREHRHASTETQDRCSNNRGRVAGPRGLQLEFRRLGQLGGERRTGRDHLLAVAVRAVPAEVVQDVRREVQRVADRREGQVPGRPR